MAKKPRLFGAEYSVYVRIARLCLLEKDVEYQLVPIDIFADEGPPVEYLARHPFGRIPAFEHDGFSLYTRQGQLPDISTKHSRGRSFSPQMQQVAHDATS